MSAMKMNKDSQLQTQNPIPFISIVPFLLITFLISWGILALYIFLSEPMTKLFGQLSGNHLLFFSRCLGTCNFGIHHYRLQNRL